MKSMIFFAAVLATACGMDAAELPLAVDAAQSRVEVVVKATMDSFVGKLETYQAEITVDTERGEITRATFAFHFIDVMTGKSDRDTEMHAWQETSAHPDGTFTLAALERDAKAADRWRARGTLVLHGRAVEIVFPASVTHERGIYVIDGDATLDTRDFGLPIIRKFKVLKVDPEVHVRFHLQGSVSAPAAQPTTTDKLN